MDSLDSLFTIIGIAAIGLGIYMLIAKKLIGRKVEDIPKEKVLKFIPYESATYILLGLLMFLQGQEKNIPFMQNKVIVAALMVVAVLVIAGNGYFSNKILGPVRNSIEGRRLK